MHIEYKSVNDGRSGRSLPLKMNERGCVRISDCHACIIQWRDSYEYSKKRSERQVNLVDLYSHLIITKPQLAQLMFIVHMYFEDAFQLDVAHVYTTVTMDRKNRRKVCDFFTVM